MTRVRVLRSALVGGASVLALVSPASAKVFDVPDGDLATALDSYIRQSGVQLIYMNEDVRGHRSKGAHGNLTEIAALTQILKGTGLTAQTMPSSAIDIVPAPQSTPEPLKVAQAGKSSAPPPAQSALETVVVTAQKKTENIQTVPIAVTALSQQQLTERQIAGGPDLLHEVPNMDFTKTNFSGYNIELRGIGTQAISVTTDPAVAVAFNDIPFIRNHFFEQEFYDLSDAEVLRGPQGTLYGRNATAGVVNLKSALPEDSYEAMVSVDMGNYNNRRLEGMLNIPIVGDKLDLRIAGEWTKRDGYSFNTITNQPIDGRDLWSGRLTLGWKPTSDIQAYLVWEHFSEDDDRLRSSKQLCKTTPTPTEIGGVPIGYQYFETYAYDPILYLDQGCQAGSLYSSSAFGVPNGYSLPYASALAQIAPSLRMLFDPYTSQTQSQNLRDIESTVNPTYRAKNDTLELNVNYNVTPALTFISQTGYNNDFLWSSEDYNRFDTAPGFFFYQPSFQPLGWQTNSVSPDPNGLGRCNYINNPANPGPCYGLAANAVCKPTSLFDGNCGPDAVFCDPQVGCSDRLAAEDLSDERSWQFSQEFRLSSNFGGPLNFSAGGNFLHYETEENYYVFINSLTAAAAQGLGGSPDGNAALQQEWIPGLSNNSQCLPNGFAYVNPFGSHNPTGGADNGNGACAYIDPNPLTSLNNEGHNYFLSQNPYILNSYAAFGEAYYDVAKNLKLTAGLRWTVDQKHFIDIPSELLVPGYGYPAIGVVNQSWDRWTGRFVADWTPQLDFTDQTLFYASYAHGYKAGGANPPGATLLTFFSTDIANPIHPLTFKPEYIEAFELGTKNTLLDGSLTLNGDVFYYNYTGYQISEIVDRTAINNNYNAHVEGAEVEANWEPLPGLKFNFAGGWEDTVAAGGDSGIDLMDRTAGNPGWMVVKPFITQASNCILPVYVVAAMLDTPQFPPGPLVSVDNIPQACANAYTAHLDPETILPYVQDPTVSNHSSYIPPGYAGFNPATAPNDGEGFAKNLSGNALPNAPPFTISLGGEYSMPISEDWVATLRGDFYWQADSWARIFNDNPYDRLRGYTNLNLTLVLTGANGWTVMGYVKNVFDTTAITGDFLNSDDSGLTTNVFLEIPRLFGVRVTKQLDQNEGFWGSDWSGYDFFTGLFSDADNGKSLLWIEVGGDFDQLADVHQLFSPPFASSLPAKWGSQIAPQNAPSTGLDWEARVSFEPTDSDWVFSASARYGRADSNRHFHAQTNVSKPAYGSFGARIYQPRYVETHAGDSETHAILDFMAGKNVGLGMFGLPGTSVLSGGARYAAFTSKSGFDIFSAPDSNNLPTAPKYHYHRYSSAFDAARSFHGIGPTLDWKGSTPIEGNDQDGDLTFDWGANGAVLFGRQKAVGMHKTSGAYYCSNGFRGELGTKTVPCPVPTPAHLTRGNDSAQRNQISHYQRTKSFNRSRMAAVPNIGAFVGLSMRYNNAKVSFGYRADEFFGAMDGGIDSYKAENRGFFGPYASISIGLGG